MSILTQVSPGIQVNEIDLTGIVPAVSTSVGAFVGQFYWGPCNEPQMISDENELVSTFGEPSPLNSESFAGQCFFSCASFLSYTNALYAVRTVNANSALNANDTGNANISFLIYNKADYENRYQFNSNTQTAVFVAKYPGSLGNSLKVSMCSNANAFSTWTYSGVFDNAPGTSSYVQQTTGSTTANDELHIVVIDSKGQFTGRANTIIEKFGFLSKALDAIDSSGVSAYYKTYLKDYSQYIYVLDHQTPANATGWGNTCIQSTTFAKLPNYTVQLSGGSNGNTVTDGELISNWNIFKNKDMYEISLAFAGSASSNVIQSVVDNVILGVESETPTMGRKDAIFFISPRLSDVYQCPGQEATNIVTGSGGTLSFLQKVDRYSSYMVCDSGWKKMYDRYNNTYRWIPLNADIAGLCAYTDAVADPWYSPGGYNRGKLKNVVSLAWSPNQTDRDTLYKNGVNPVITQRGEGVVLLGDKTMQAKPSAFDRINVRRLFIVLEKAISRAARYSLFEFNDEFTRAQFVAMVEPYLRTVKGRRGIIDYKVVCDATNNTGDIIDRNGFVGDIYIKPARSINFIQLNFIAVKTGVEFSTVIGQW